MTIYIWESVSGLTDRYQDGGGCAVVAADLAAARELLPKWCEAQTAAPDFSCDVPDQVSKAFIFPDAGCC